MAYSNEVNRHGTRAWKGRRGPAGLHLFDRISGSNLLLDELQIPMEFWDSAPRQVSIALTNACDLTCDYCYAPKTPARLDFQCLIKWLCELDENGCLGVGFGGGEPTLYPRLPDLCRYATKNTRLAVTLTTHGHHLDDDLVSKLFGQMNFIRVSMDGVGSTYESLRGKSFTSLRAKLANVRRLSPFGINFVVNARTFSDLDNAIAVATDAGASEFLLLPEQPTHGNDGIDSKTAEALRLWVARQHGPLPLWVSEAGSDGLPICRPLIAEQGLRKYAHIDASGTLKRTSFEKEGIRIGDDGVMRALADLQNDSL